MHQNAMLLHTKQNKSIPVHTRQMKSLPVHTKQMKGMLIHTTTLNPPTLEHSLLKMDSKIN
jgi:hypothetical protein